MAAPTPSERATRQARIRTVFDEHKGRYGYRQITAVLCK
ncbi:IS3 family transposase [Acidovorax sp. NPDC077693]